LLEDYDNIGDLESIGKFGASLILI